MKGVFLVITGPSGSGKTTVVERLLAALPSAARLVTTTTRDPRPKEKNGVDYHFVSREDFIAMRERGEFLEWAEVYGEYYGSSRVVLDDLRGRHGAVFAVLDVQGAASAKREVPDAIVVFLKAPLAQLKERLERRVGMPPDKVARRLAEYERELSTATAFDHMVDCSDGNLGQTCFLITSIIAMHRKVP